MRFYGVMQTIELLDLDLIDWMTSTASTWSRRLDEVSVSSSCSEALRGLDTTFWWMRE